MVRILDFLADAESRLEAVTDTPRLDAEILLAHSLGLSRAGLLARLQDDVESDDFEALLKRRADGEPIAYILGEWEFYALSFEIVPPVLVPRPETEHLVEVVLQEVGEREALVLDVGTGSGCVSIAIAVNAPATRVTTSDINPDFLDLARRNAVRHEVERGIAFREGDLFNALKPSDGPFDVICSNPPYVEEGAWEGLSPTITRFEDRGALLAGPEGLDVIRRLVAEALNQLKPGGLLAFELGMGQDEAVSALLAQHGYADIRFVDDLAGIPRVALGRTPGND